MTKMCLPKVLFHTLPRSPMSASVPAWTVLEEGWSLAVAQLRLCFSGPCPTHFPFTFPLAQHHPWAGLWCESLAEPGCPCPALLCSALLPGWGVGQALPCHSLRTPSCCVWHWDSSMANQSQDWSPGRHNLLLPYCFLPYQSPMVVKEWPPFTWGWPRSRCRDSLLSSLNLFPLCPGGCPSMTQHTNDLQIGVLWCSQGKGWFYWCNTDCFYSSKWNGLLNTVPGIAWHSEVCSCTPPSNGF